MSNKMQHYTVYFIWKLLYMFQAVLPPIIGSANNCIYSIWYLSHRYCYLSLSWKSWNWFECAVRYCYLPVSWKRWNWFECAVYSTLKPVPTLPRQRQVAVKVWQIPDAVDTVVCAPDDGWWYHPKHVDQFPDKINCVTLHLVGHILECSYDARTHECWI